MTVCPQNAPGPLVCPTLQESIDQTLALLPGGRAWQSQEGGPLRFKDAAFDPAAFDPAAFDTVSKPGTILYRFWAAIGAVRNFVEARLCALRLEFWCATMSETRDQWMKEYGLPDACDPFPDLCTKVAAVGGTRCEYYAEIAARAGWSIECVTLNFHCPGPRAGRIVVGRSKVGKLNKPLCKLAIIVRLAHSIAYTGPRRRRPLVGRLKAGQRLACAPDISPLVCLLERVVHAHIEIDYQTA